MEEVPEGDVRHGYAGLLHEGSAKRLYEPEARGVNLGRGIGVKRPMNAFWVGDRFLVPMLSREVNTFRDSGAHRFGARRLCYSPGWYLKESLTLVR